MQTGIELITEERQKQLKKWDADHDSTHNNSELRKMAAVLCCMDTDVHVVSDDSENQFVSGGEEWGLEEKLKDDEIRRLKVAGALIAAEIDRIQAKKDENTLLGKLIKEEEELSEKYDAMRKQLASDSFLDEVGDYQYDLMCAQRSNMETYIKLLKMRIENLEEAKTK